MIYSFGYRWNSPIPSPARPDILVIDVRKLLTRNPYHDKKLRKLRGDDPLVIEDIERTPDLEKSYQTIKARAEWFISTYNGDVYLGCTGGHHRSVYIANRLGQDLGIPVKHLNYDTRESRQG